MKKTAIFIFISILGLLVSCGVKYDIEIPHWNYDNLNSDQVLPPMPDPAKPKVPTLVTADDATFGPLWKRDTINSNPDDLLVYYSFKGKHNGHNQEVHVVELNLNSEKYRVDLRYGARATTADVLRDYGDNNTGRKAIVAVNGGYEKEAIYIRVKNTLVSDVTLNLDVAKDILRYWKHDAVFFSDGKNGIGIVDGRKNRNLDDPDSETEEQKLEDRKNAIEYYNTIYARNMIASSPLLIDNFDDRLGKYFVEPKWKGGKYNNSEDYRAHQGGVNPRTVYALTEDNDLLLIALDGRGAANGGTAKGMNAEDVTSFIKKHFNPQWALNMDGGGSTTLCIDGKGDKYNVVNRPARASNKVYGNLNGLRDVTSHVVIWEKEN